MLALIGLALFLTLTAPSPAWAYIDPGAGSYLFQLAIAGAAAGLYTLRRYWHTIVRTARSVLKRSGSDTPRRGTDVVE